VATEVVMSELIYSNVYPVPDVRDGKIVGTMVRITFVDETDKSSVEIRCSLSFLQGLRDQIDAVLKR